MHINWLILLEKMWNNCLMKIWPTHYFFFKLLCILHTTIATRECIIKMPRICLFLHDFFRQSVWKPSVKAWWVIFGRMLCKKWSLHDMGNLGSRLLSFNVYCMCERVSFFYGNQSKYKCYSIVCKISCLNYKIALYLFYKCFASVVLKLLWYTCISEIILNNTFSIVYQFIFNVINGIFQISVYKYELNAQSFNHSSYSYIASVVLTLAFFL